MLQWMPFGGGSKGRQPMIREKMFMYCRRKTLGNQQAAATDFEMWVENMNDFIFLAMPTSAAVSRAILNIFYCIVSRPCPTRLPLGRVRDANEDWATTITRMSHRVTMMALRIHAVDTWTSQMARHQHRFMFQNLQFMKWAAVAAPQFFERGPPAYEVG